MTLTTVRDGLATRLDTISGLRVYATPPDSVQELPAAIVSFRSPVSTYDHVIGAADATFRFEVLLLVGSADEGQAQQDVEPYMSPTGASSVMGAVDGTLGGNADWARAGQGTPLARLAFPEKLGSHYWGTKFPVDVYESG